MRPFDCASPGDDHRPASLLISPDALSLVRFGLRAAEDPRIVDTVRAIDALLKIDLPQGPVWYRYNLDGYGEHEDGRPFDGSGIGRPWPLLTGERAHYELAARRPEIAMQLLGTLEGSASPGGLLPEQIWDKSDISSANSFAAAPRAAQCPWSGRMRNTSSCSDPYRMAAFSICRRSRLNGIRYKKSSHR